MMKRMLVIAGLLGVLVVSGCESMGMAKSDKGVVALSNHGSVVFLPSGMGGVAMLSTTGDANCAQCKMDAAEYFKTGKLTEKCAACGAMRTPLMRGK